MTKIQILNIKGLIYGNILKELIRCRLINTFLHRHCENTRSKYVLV